MRTIHYTTTAKSMLADIYTPVGIYLRLRDYFRDAVLLESNAGDGDDNNFSFIGINAIAGIEMTNKKTLEYRLPNEDAKVIKLKQPQDAIDIVQQFMNCFEAEKQEKFPLSVAQGMLGYISYDAVTLFEQIELTSNEEIPLLRFRFYQYIIAIDHFKDELFIIENTVNAVPSTLDLLETILQKKDVPNFPFITINDELQSCTDEAYKQKVTAGIEHCKVGNVFQVVLSRQFEQSFQGDEFNVYRQLRSINPSPYLFYFDYGNYRLFGSSPESQIIINDKTCTIHPIAGTIKRSGNLEKDASSAQQLIDDAKENAEHTMLVDLARNDLSIFCNNIKVNYYKKLKTYSHLMHLVSEVVGTLKAETSNLFALGKSFPAGTLSGAPKYKAMQIINELEDSPRGFYGGAIGMLSFNGEANMAIMIRTFMSKNNSLHYRAGAGVVIASNPDHELIEVNNKIAALRQAIIKANKN